MSSRPRTALIVGAGVGGLAAGIALQRAGWHVRVFERAAHARELGFALLLAPNALVSLEHLGVADRVIAAGSEMTGGEICGTAGRVLRRFDLTSLRELLPQPALVVLRPALYSVLLDAFGPQHVSLDSEANGVSFDGATPALRLTNGDVVEGNVVVGADGVASVIRRVLHPSEPPPRRSGLWAVRGVAHGVERHVAELAGAQYFGRGTEGGIARAGRDAVSRRDAVYWYVSVTTRQVGDSRDPERIAQGAVAQFDQRFQAIVSATNPTDMRLDELLDREPLPRWGRGPVTLLGDAAHPMLPHAGQGAAQALEDAVAIGRALDGLIDVHAALRAYEQVRSRRVHRIVRIARRNARFGSMTSWFGQTLRDFVIRVVPASVFTKTYLEFGSPPALEFGRSVRARASGRPPDQG
jgi:2-polyprenyl-6-methoxyphenol hydroxylase-like FAD-dependent oxidoreductase